MFDFKIFRLIFVLLNLFIIIYCNFIIFYKEAWDLENIIDVCLGSMLFLIFWEITDRNKK